MARQPRNEVAGSIYHVMIHAVAETVDRPYQPRPQDARPDVRPGRPPLSLAGARRRDPGYALPRTDPHSRDDARPRNAVPQRNLRTGVQPPARPERGSVRRPIQVQAGRDRRPASHDDPLHRSQRVQRRHRRPPSRRRLEQLPANSRRDGTLALHRHHEAAQLPRSKPPVGVSRAHRPRRGAGHPSKSAASGAAACLPSRRTRLPRPLRTHDRETDCRARRSAGRSG